MMNIWGKLSLKHSLKLIIIGFFILTGLILGKPQDRYFVGEVACRQCHHNGNHNDPFNKWYLSAHARSYSALSMPEALKIAELSGIDVNPFQSPICLKCHTTASDTEIWQRNEEFFWEDGVQCENCHGPGSEYIEMAINKGRHKVNKAGLKIPGEDFCLVCHYVKDSHRAVLNSKPFNFKSFMDQLFHSDKRGKLSTVLGIDNYENNGKKKSLFIGAMKCAECHQGASQNYMFSKWRLSAHANAYAILSNGKKCKLSKKKKMDENSQKSDVCLNCHATGGGDTTVWGVQCENCHGNGIAHVKEKIDDGLSKSGQTGLITPTRKTCIRCHKEKDFDFNGMKQKIAHWHVQSVKASSDNNEMTYKTPFNLAVSPEGDRLYVVCEGSDTLIVLDTINRTLIAEIGVQNQPHGICLSRDGKRIYVSNRGSDSVSVIDHDTLRVLRHIPVGDEPHGLETSSGGNVLYVANTGSNDISVIDLKNNREIKRLSAGRGTWAMKRSPGHDSVYVTNNLSHFVKFRTPSLSEVTIIDTQRSVVKQRIMIPEANLVQGIDFSPNGEFALVTLLRTKNLVPITRVMQGWMITNGIGIIYKNGQVDQLLLDETDNYFADPTDLVITPDGKFAYVTGGGIDAVAVIHLGKMKNILKSAGKKERQDILPNHLGISSEYIIKRIPVGKNPRGLAVSNDGQFVYVADGLDDTISVIDVNLQQRIDVIDLGGPKKITLKRKGERIFHNAEVTFGRQFSCHTCHPDGGIDGLTYDIEPDGIGVNPVDNRTLRGILDTPPFKWTGKNESLKRQCGPRLAVFFTRIDPFTPEQVVALDRYICTIPRNPNRYRKGTELTPAQQRGKLLFQRTHNNLGEEIPLEYRCDYCHSGPYFTNRRIVDVGTQSRLDTHGKFDVPHLNNIYETAPYLHDGQSDTLEEIWTRFNPENKHGATNDMTKDQLNDLMEYLKTL